MTSVFDGSHLRRGEMQSALATLAEMHHAVPGARADAPYATGFSPLDDVLSGGIRAGELVLVGGKPGIGKTIACLQWARSMAQRGVVAVYLCFEHDQATLLSRLLSCELREAALAAGRHFDLGLEELQGRLRDVASGTLTLREALGSDPLLGEAERRVAAYADRLVLFQGSGSRTDAAAAADAMSRFGHEPRIIFVDYVQKMPVVPALVSEADRVTRVVDSLKELALDQDIPVVAISAADQHGLTARRLHLHHLRGSAALAYEADAALMLNDKLDVVSRAHIAYSTNRIEEFRQQVVFSLEKNRNGTNGVDLEFVKDFGHYRFDPRGSWVAERLWSEHSVEA
ncbi:MAG TPA: DnaB-like helicase C-terminal domain-containing protein [Acidimicrobiales bacterium]